VADVDAAPASSAAASKAGTVADTVGSSFAAISRLVLGSGGQEAGPAKGKVADVTQASETTDAAAAKDQGVLVQPTASGTTAAAGGADVGAVRDVLRSALGLPLKVQVVSESPCVIIIDNFLPGPLCQQVMDLAGPRLIRSRVASGEGVGATHATRRQALALCVRLRRLPSEAMRGQYGQYIWAALGVRPWHYVSG
jgi:hypothetical protein